ncbi:MAG: hypothetical protein U0T81_14145 [Saprospiraceae bacterium]
MLGEDGMIYFWRDNGAFNAYRDNGSSFDKVWVYQPVQTTGTPLLYGNGNWSSSSIFIFDIDHWSTWINTPEMIFWQLANQGHCPGLPYRAQTL